MNEERCETCGDEIEEVMGTKWCQLCRDVAEEISPRVEAWVFAVARKAAKDAVDAARATLVWEE